jgi:hypothetical protein
MLRMGLVGQRGIKVVFEGTPRKQYPSPLKEAVPLAP